jgi:hypothetical protein
VVLGRGGDAGHSVEVANFYASNISGALLRIVPFDFIDVGIAELIEWVAKSS